MSPATALLNAEPSQPEKRAELDLAPKTYVDAVEENINGTHEPSDHSPKATVGEHEDGKPHIWKSEEMSGVAERNGIRKEIDKDKLLYEKFEDNNGDALTSVKPADGYEESLAHGKKSAPKAKRNPEASQELVSGRRAGAGWGRSRYA